MRSGGNLQVSLFFCNTIEIFLKLRYNSKDLECGVLGAKGPHIFIEEFKVKIR